MAKIPFSIDYRPQIDSGEYKVETRDGKPVRIICWDKKSEKKYGYHIVGLIDYGTEESAYYTIDGKRLKDKEMEQDLFIITPEQELSEFKLKVQEILYSDKQEYSASDPESWKRASSELLDLARKELEPEVLERLKLAYKNQYENGKRDGKAEALKDLKDLPRWIDDGLPMGSGAIDISGLCGFDFIRRNGKLLRISSIEKLPGFND